MKDVKIMAVFAHPADPITNCGGTLALHSERGDSVCALILTHGGRIHPNIYAEEWRKEQKDQSLISAEEKEIIENKKKELEEAADIIGIHKLITLDYPDDYIYINDEIVRTISDKIIQEKPDIIIMDYPHNTDYPNDHSLATLMAFRAISLSGKMLKNLDQEHEYHVKQVFLNSVPVHVNNSLSLDGVRNDTFIDISSVVGKKIKAMDCFVSQGYNGSFARKAVESYNGVYGRLAGVDFAEAFCRLKSETHEFLPLTEHALNLDHMTVHKTETTMNIREMFPEKPK